MKQVNVRLSDDDYTTLAAEHSETFARHRLPFSTWLAQRIHERANRQRQRLTREARAH